MKPYKKKAVKTKNIVILLVLLYSYIKNQG